MDRREFLQWALQGSLFVGVFGLAGCGRESQLGRDAASGTEFLERGEVIMYDTYAMALYMDGGLGPKTGIIKVDYILKNEALALPFWHGHGGKTHQFTLLPAHFDQLKQMKKVTIETTAVDSHTHKLFIDPKDPKWRVPGAPGIPVPIL